MALLQKIGPIGYFAPRIPVLGQISGLTLALGVLGRL
jgi:hypothetical protein